MRIRQISEKDLSKILNLEVENFSHPWSLQSLSEMIENPNTIFLGMEIDADGEQELAGYCLFLQFGDNYDLCRIATSEKRKRQGIASKLLQEGADNCRKQGAGEILLEVRESNAAAIALYQRYKFKKIGTRKNYYRAPSEDAIVMCKKLP